MSFLNFCKIAISFRVTQSDIFLGVKMFVDSIKYWKLKVNPNYRALIISYKMTDNYKIEP